MENPFKMKVPTYISKEDHHARALSFYNKQSENSKTICRHFIDCDHTAVLYLTTFEETQSALVEANR
jgi:hypothetical protein